MSSIIAYLKSSNVVHVSKPRVGFAEHVQAALMDRTEKCSPMRLAPIPWGKRDRELGFKVLQNIVDTMPPIVVPWSIKATRIVQSIHSHGGIDLKVRDLRTLIPERFRPRSV